MKNFNYSQASSFLLRCGAAAEYTFKNKLRVTTLINIGNKLYQLTKKEPHNLGNTIKMVFILLERKQIQEELLNLNYNILTKKGTLRSFWSLIHEINRVGPHPKLVSIFGVQTWDTIKYLFKYK